MDLWGLNKMIHLICFVNRKCNLFLKCQQMMLILLTDFAASGEAGYGNGSHAWLWFTLLDFNLSSTSILIVSQEKRLGLRLLYNPRAGLEKLSGPYQVRVYVWNVLKYMQFSDLSTRLGLQVLELKCLYLTPIMYKDENHIIL